MTLYNSILCILLLFGPYPKDPITLKGKVKFVSDAPLELIKAESNKLNGVIDLSSNLFAFSVPLKSFEGFNSALQKEHFHENYMESEQYPKITYSGKLLDKIDLTTNGEFECRTKGIFNIHGIQKERILKNKIIVSNGIIYIETKFTILLVDYNISIPKIVHKKISEEIQVTVTAENKI